MSALAKRYDKNGSEYMDRILEQSGSRSLIPNLSLVELESVLGTQDKDRRDQPAVVRNRPTAPGRSCAAAPPRRVCE